MMHENNTNKQVNASPDNQAVDPPTEVVQEVYNRLAHFYFPTIDDWKQALLGANHPGLALLIYEQLARAYEHYIAQHPEAEGDESILKKLRSLTNENKLEDDGNVDEQLTEIWGKAWQQQWVPLQPSEPWLDDGLECHIRFNQLVAVCPHGNVIPNLQQGLDAREVLFAAAVIDAVDATSGKRYCVHGEDCFDEESILLPGMQQACVTLNTEDKEEFATFCSIVKMAKTPPEME